MRLFLFLFFLIAIPCKAQEVEPKIEDSTTIELFEKGSHEVNSCTPGSHLHCVKITFSEVYHDGKEGKFTRHWWRMSYIGRAYKDKYGKVIGTIFEGAFAIPHYIGVGIGNGLGYTVFLIRGSPEKIHARKEKRRLRKNGEIK